MVTEGNCSRFSRFRDTSKHCKGGAPTGEVEHRPRCGAAGLIWSIATDGRIYPCPVLRTDPKYQVGSIDSVRPQELRSSIALGEPCTRCDIFDLCGGRCLFANAENQWDNESFRLVCSTVEHLVAELRRVQPAVERTIATGTTSVEALIQCRDYEVIP